MRTSVNKKEKYVQGQRRVNITTQCPTEICLCALPLNGSDLDNLEKNVAIVIEIFNAALFDKHNILYQLKCNPPPAFLHCYHQVWLSVHVHPQPFHFTVSLSESFVHTTCTLPLEALQKYCSTVIPNNAEGGNINGWGIIIVIVMTMQNGQTRCLA